MITIIQTVVILDADWLILRRVTALSFSSNHSAAPSLLMLHMIVLSGLEEFNEHFITNV